MEILNNLLNNQQQTSSTGSKAKRKDLKTAKNFIIDKEFTE